MENVSQKMAGYSLLIGSVLIIVTMMMHPAGSTVEQILHIANLAISAHSLAIFSIPFLLFGFWGLSQHLSNSANISPLAFMFCGIGMVAVMIAAAINGLTLPFFVRANADATGQNLETLKMILNYGKQFNKSMDYIFIACISIGMGIWSGIIIYSGKLPKWTGYYGIGLIMMVLIAMFLNFNLASLFGFRIYIFGLASWIILMGWLMIKRV
jgi:hypothetical protein